MVWTCPDERFWVYWETDADDGTARKLGRSKRRFVDAVTEDMAVAEVTEEDAEDRTECGDH